MTLEELIKQSNLTKKKVSDLSGVPWATLCDLVSKKTDINHASVLTIRKIAHTLHLSTDEFLDLINESHTFSPFDFFVPIPVLEIVWDLDRLKSQKDLKSEVYYFSKLDQLDILAKNYAASGIISKDHYSQILGRYDF